MQRRLFVWFGVSILVTAFVVSAVTAVVDRVRGPSARAQWDNVQSLIGAQAARVWTDPRERDAWASELAQQLGWAIRLDDVSGNEHARFGPSSMRWSASAPVLRDGVEEEGGRSCSRWRWRWRRSGPSLAASPGSWPGRWRS